MLLTLASSGLLYAACVALFHAKPSRSRISLAQSPKGPLLLRVGGLMLIAAALVVLAHDTGWERAIPIGLGVLGMAGVLNLLANSFTPNRHVAGGALALVIGVVSGAAVFLG